MAKLVILGAGIAGHTAALHARSKLGDDHEVIVVSPNSRWNWIPSNVWVGVGLMGADDVTFELAPVYDRCGIDFVQAKAGSIHPEGDDASAVPYVMAEHTGAAESGKVEKIPYDFLINATGPKLNFGATEGLGPGNNSLSVCTYLHAAETARELDSMCARMQMGERLTLLFGVGHGMCTCQGAAFEYLFNVEYELRRRKLRDRARMIWISNEQELGDFGMGGLHLKRGGYITHSSIFTQSLFVERGIEWITRAHVQRVAPGEAFYENLAGEERSVAFDFAMLLPPFAGVGIKAVGRQGEDITSDLFAPNGFMFVDGDYAAKPYEEWQPTDWPSTYQNPRYPRLFSVGIAFAPPHPISKPVRSPRGTPIFPTPPRTGMPSGVMAREVAYNIVDMINEGHMTPKRSASMANMGAACIASAGAGMLKGSAVSMTVYPIVPDFAKYPDTGRHLRYTTGEIGLAGHWLKRILHHVFIYKAKAKPLWKIIPE
ncbi:MAG TPA: FAD/NAD(P)-binding oxidoreductase [Geobacteraceae bacterium]